MTVLTIVNIVVLLALAAFTYFYMRHTGRLADDTKRMADIMVREFELTVSPFIVIDRLSTSGGRSSKEYQPVITNKGSLPVRIKSVVLEWRYKELPDKVYPKETPIDIVLGKNESTGHGDHVIKIRKHDMEKDDFEASGESEFIQLLPLAEGKIYCTYTDAAGNERKTGVLRTLESL